jgi:hypothetical protein
MDIDAANKELDKYEEKYLESNETIKSLIASTNTSYKEINLEGTSIRIRRHMPKKTRSQALKTGKKLENANEDNIEEAEKGLYPIVASMCVDEPFSRSETWEYIDKKTGCIQEVLLKILAEVNQTDESIKSFRRKQ